MISAIKTDDITSTARRWRPLVDDPATMLQHGADLDCGGIGEMTMFDWANPRGLCLNPPHGSLIAACERWPEWGKHIETRGHWPYAWRSTLLIHQTKGLGDMYGDEGDLQYVGERPPFRATLAAMGYARASELPRGKVVAVARLFARVSTDAMQGKWGREYYGGRSWHLTDRERSFGNYAPGRYALLLADIRALPEPVTCRGQQGLWIPDVATVAAVRQQVER